MDTRTLLTLKELDGVGPKALLSLIGLEPDENLSLGQMIDLCEMAHQRNRRVPIPLHREVAEAQERADRIMEQCHQGDIHILTILNEAFPHLVRRAGPTPPAILYVRGNYEALTTEQSVAIVGTRNPSERAGRAAHELSRRITGENFVVISGLALGCDTAAHRGCLSGGGYTVAALGHGLDSIYPEGNLDLAEDIVYNGGCLVSEYAPRVKVTRAHLVRRNYLQASLSRGVLVIQSTPDGGSRYAAKAAVELDRPLGSLAPFSAAEGVHYLAGHQSLQKIGAQEITDSAGSIHLFLSRCMQQTPGRSQLALF